MAEQNRKTAEQRELRAKAEAVVDNFIDYLLAIRRVDDIAHEGRHILGIYQSHGEIPRGSGFSGFCTLAAKVDRIRFQEVTSRMVEADSIVGQLAEDHQEAVCLDKLLRGKTRIVAIDPLNEKRLEITYTTAYCAELLGLSQDTYRKRVSRAYQQIENVLQPVSQVA
ncbi:hypothetical protein [Marinobacter nauticus]|uniref:hypothetical protein n=1 Tax=Marinobacter nauticus TaxID=2743 RepID=UPI000EAE4C42|nr:hypothetical protein [Marinobacter nauticus]RKR79187.1 hypothetical protein C7436_0625 [Marinobacter nauticus]